MDIFSEIPEKVAFIADFKEYDVGMYYHKKLKADPQNALVAVRAAEEALEGMDDFTHDSLNEAFAAAAEKAGIKKGLLLWSVRIAVTGAAVTPGGATEMADILGKEESLRRLKFSEELLEKAICNA